MDEGLPPETDMVLGSDEEDEAPDEAPARTTAPGDQDDTQVQDMEEGSSSSSSDTDDDDDDTDSDSDDEKRPSSPAMKDNKSMLPPAPPSQPPQPTPEPPKPSQIIVRDYDPR